MKSRLLLPHAFNLIGWLLALPGLLLGYLNRYNGFEIPGFGAILRDKDLLFSPQFEQFTNELALTLIVVGLVFVAFSKQKSEDELTAKMRLNALYWAILINYTWYGIFIILALFSAVIQIKGVVAIVELVGDNLSFMVFNLFTPLVIFIIRFYYLLYKSRNEYEIKPIKLLPNKPYRVIGLLLTAMLLIAFIIVQLTVEKDDVGSALFCMLPLVMLLWVFSKEKEEDEYINSVRMDAMQIAVYANYLILLLANLVMYGIDFYLVLIVNLLTIPLIFLIVFHYRLYKIRQADVEQGKSNLNINLL